MADTGGGDTFLADAPFSLIVNQLTIAAMRTFRTGTWPCFSGPAAKHGMTRTAGPDQGCQYGYILTESDRISPSSREEENLHFPSLSPSWCAILLRSLFSSDYRAHRDPDPKIRSPTSPTQTHVETIESLFQII